MDTPGATPPPLSPPIGARVWPSGWLVSVVEETGSTNADLLAEAEQGAPDRTVLVARHQTAGRGRLDRRWEAPPGANLLVSLLFREIPESPHVLTQRVGLAALAACEQVARVRPTLKWPNDLLLNGAKLAGILAQTKLGVQPAVVVGIGINVGWAPQGSAQLGDIVDPLDLLVALLQAYDTLPVDVWMLYRQNLGTLGRSVRVEMSDGTIEGRALDVEPDGRLVVIDDLEKTHHVAVGDVIHLR